MHYSAIGQKNKKLLLLSQQRLTVFGPPKTPRFLHQTRKFVQSIEGLVFMKRYKHNMKYILRMIGLEVSWTGQRSCLAVSKDHDRNLFRGRVFSNRNSWFKEPTLPDTVNNPCQSVKSVVKYLLLVPISVNSWFFQNFFSQNEPNCNESDVAASNCYGKVYNDFSRKIHQKNEPKRSQLNPIFPNIYVRGLY